LQNALAYAEDSGPISGHNGGKRPLVGVLLVARQKLGISEFAMGGTRGCY
jgi:hypothetical protein